MGYTARLIGACELRLGEVTEARGWFAEGALYGRGFVSEFIGKFDDLGSGYDASGGLEARNGLYAAILTGDDRLVDVLVADVHTLINDAPDHAHIDQDELYWKARTTAALVEGDRETADESRREYAEYVSTDYDEALYQTHGGFIADDADQIQQGLASIVRIHEENLDSIKTWNQPVSLSGCAHLMLARHREMDIWVDSEFVPEGLREYDMDGRIDLPHPEYVDPDLIPE